MSGLAVVGLGLIGGSILRDLDAAGAPARGWDPDPEVRRAATAAGHHVVAELSDAVVGCDLIVVAAPPAASAPVALAVLDAAPTAVVCDTCSVKGPVLDAVTAAGAGSAARFVGGHPLAGSERSGFGAARGGLFARATWALCPGRAEVAAVVAVAALVERLGAHALVISPDEHDRAVARSSHLPHLLAGVAARVAATEPAATLSGGALRDATRVAGSDGALWQEILLGNAGPIGDALDELRTALDAVQAILAAGDRDGLSRALAAGITARDDILRARWGAEDWAAGEAALDGWRATLEALGRQGRAVRRLELQGTRLRFEAARAAGSGYLP